MDKFKSIIISCIGLGIVVGSLGTVLPFVNTVILAIGLGLIIGALHTKK